MRKEVWVAGADKVRDPEQDMPPDFVERRRQYYAELSKPLRAEMACELRVLQEALPTCD